MSPELETPQIASASPPVLDTFAPGALEPVSAGERIETLDLLRGFALLGILVVNVPLFGWPIYQLLTGVHVWASRADAMVDWAVRFLVQGKFYLLFSFLFGLGAAIQWERAQARGRRWGPFLARRFLVLLGIGLAHAFLLWEGDILVCYAMCGFLLLAFCNRKPKTLLIWAVVLSLIPVLLYAGFWMLVSVASLVPEGAKAIHDEFARQKTAFARLAEQDLRVFREGPLGQVFAERARNVLFIWQCTLFYGPSVLGLFLVGLYAGKRRLVQEADANLRFIRRTLIWGVGVGLPLGVVYAITSGLSSVMDMNLTLVVSVAALAVGGPALCFAYAATFTLLARRDSWRRRLHPVAAAGRMGLSNYLLQSLVCSSIFYSYGLGWYGSVGRWSALALAVAIYALQLPLSVWWLKRYRFGPAEWVWRTLTYGKCQPMRL